MGTPQGYPVPLRLSRDDDAKTAIPIGPCGNSSLASAWVLVGLSLCRRGSNQVSCCCQRGWCTELHIGQGGEFRSEVEIGGCTTRVLAEQTAAADLVDAARMPGYLGHHEMRRVDAALRIVLGL